MSLPYYNSLQNIYKEYYRCSKGDNRYFYITKDTILYTLSSRYVNKRPEAPYENTGLHFSRSCIER